MKIIMYVSAALLIILSITTAVWQIKKGIRSINDYVDEATDDHELTIDDFVN